MNRRQFLKCIGLTCAAAPFAGCNAALMDTSARPDKPNILYLFADDLCFEAVRALGCDEVETPNLDRLVRRGVTFTHAYNMGAWHGAVCVASRTMLNTGRFLWNAFRTEPDLKKETKQGHFWSQYMKKAGYDTYMSGKWHVKGIAPPDIFDVVRDVRPGMPNQTPQGYNRPIEGREDVWKPWDTKNEGYWKGGKHWSEVLGDHGVEFIRTASGKDNPFFMYLAFNAPHDPRQSPKEYVDKYPLEKVKVPSNFLAEYPYKDSIGCGKSLRDEKLAPFPRTEYAVKVNRQEYYAIITHMDAQVGRILDELEKSGKADNTYIFFTADHGLAVGHHGLIGKQNMYDHSLRVPLMVCGPGIKNNERVSSPVYLQDIMPTTLEMAGVKKPSQVEFHSLLPVLDGRRQANYDYIYGGYINLQRMVFDGRYKVIYYPMIQRHLLYDLKNDPLEMRDLAENPKFTSKLDEMKTLLAKAMKQMDDPLDMNDPKNWSRNPKKAEK